MTEWVGFNVGSRHVIFVVHILILGCTVTRGLQGPHGRLFIVYCLLSTRSSRYIVHWFLKVLTGNLSHLSTVADRRGSHDYLLLYPLTPN